MEPDKPKISAKEKNLRKKFRKVFGSAEGKEVLDYITEAICGWSVSNFFENPRKADFWMGQRSVAKRLKTLTDNPVNDEEED